MAGVDLSRSKGAVAASADEQRLVAAGIAVVVAVAVVAVAVVAATARGW
jgi:hypothetical protein